MSKRGIIFIGIILIQIYTTTATFACMTVDFTVDNPNPVVGQEITFTDNSVVTDGDPITNWEWNFGDGADPSTANTQGPHQVFYYTEGAKTVSLIVTHEDFTSNPQSATETKTDFIVVDPSPVVPFSMLGVLAVFLLIGLFIVLRIRKKLALN